MSKLDEATELVERAAGAAGKLAEQVAGAAGTVAKIAKEAGIGRGKARGTDQAPPAKARAGKKQEKNPTTVPARQYAWRALAYALFFTLGAVFLLLYLIKAEGPVVFILPAVLGVAFFLFLAGGFRLAYASLRPRAPKKTAAKAAAARVAEDILQDEPLPVLPIAKESPIGKVSDRVVKALAKLLRHYGGGLRGLLDADLYQYLHASMRGTTVCQGSDETRFYGPVLHRLSNAFHISPVEKVLASLESFSINLVRLTPRSTKFDTISVPFFGLLNALIPIHSQRTNDMAFAALARCFGIHKLGSLFPAALPTTTITLKVTIREPIETKFITDFEANQLSNPKVWEDLKKELESHFKDNLLPNGLWAKLTAKKTLDAYAEVILRIKKHTEIEDKIHELQAEKGKNQLASAAIEWKALDAFIDPIKTDSGKGDWMKDYFEGKTWVIKQDEVATTTVMNKEDLQRLKKLALALLTLKVKYLLDTNSGGNPKEFLTKSKKILELFNEVTGTVGFITLTLVGAPEGDDLKKIDTFYKSPIEVPPLPILKAEHELERWWDQATGKGYEQAILREVQRVLISLESKPLTQVAATYISFITFFTLAWKANASKTIPFSQVYVTRATQPREDATGFDYWYVIQEESPTSEGPSKKTLWQEYIEVTGSEILDEEELVGKITRFLGYQQAGSKQEAIPGMSTKDEMTVIAVGFPVNANNPTQVFVCRLDAAIRKYLQEKLKAWETQYKPKNT